MCSSVVIEAKTLSNLFIFFKKNNINLTGDEVSGGGAKFVAKTFQLTTANAK